MPLLSPFLSTKGWIIKHFFYPKLCTYRYQEWEEFAKVGVNLLERLESFLEPLGPMDSEDDDSEEAEEDNFID